jgi:hypothetical protein
MHEREYIRHDDKAASRLAPKGRDGRFDLSVAVNGRSDWLDLERPGRRLKRGHISRRDGVVGVGRCGGLATLPLPTLTVATLPLNQNSLFLAVRLFNQSLLARIYYVRLDQSREMLFIEFGFQYRLIFTTQWYALSFPRWPSHGYDFAIYPMPDMNFNLCHDFASLAIMIRMSQSFQ